MLLSDKIYTALCTFFSVLIVIGNLIYQKFVSLPLLPFHTFELSAGAVLYPLTFLLTDLITEFYGKARANFCVKLGMAMNVLVALIILFIDHLTTTSWSKIDQATFHQVFGLFGVAFIGSVLACYVSQRIDILLYSWIRRLTQGRFLWIRSNGSTALSLLVDTSIVISFLVVFKVLPAERMGALIVNSYSYKLFFTLLSTPLFYLSVSALKQCLKDKVKI